MDIILPAVRPEGYQLIKTEEQFKALLINIQWKEDVPLGELDHKDLVLRKLANDKAMSEGYTDWKEAYDDLVLRKDKI